MFFQRFIYLIYLKLAATPQKLLGPLEEEGVEFDNYLFVLDFKK